jgi:hypothetical protein
MSAYYNVIKGISNHISQGSWVLYEKFWNSNLGKEILLPLSNGYDFLRSTDFWNESNFLA